MEICRIFPGSFKAVWASKKEAARVSKGPVNKNSQRRLLNHLKNWVASLIDYLYVRTHLET